MRWSRCPDAAAFLLAVLFVAAPARAARAQDAPPPSARARWTAQKADDDARRVWGPPLEARLQGWRRSDRFDEVRAAVDDALQQFPDPRAVALVVGAVRRINSSNVSWDAKAVGVDAWNSEVALRALTQLPRPPRLRDHFDLVERGVLGAWRTQRPAASGDGERDVGQDLALLARFIRRLLDDEDRLWIPLPHAARDGPYAPVRRTDPRWHSQGSLNTPADEEGFLAYEEAWYARSLREDELWTVRDARNQWSIPDLVAAFVRRFPAGSAADAAYGATMPSEVPELPWVALLDAARRRESQMPMRSGSGEVAFWVTSRQAAFAPGQGHVGRDLDLEVHVLNRAPTPKVIPLARVRAVIVHGEAPKDDDALPPLRAPLAPDLVAVEPNHVVSVPLSIPVRCSGLARVVVALDNDIATVGERDGVWTGAERFVWYVDVSPPERGAATYRLLKAARESAARPESVESLRVEVATLARELPDDRGVGSLSGIAIAATDAQVAHAALAALASLLARGGGVDAYGAFATIAADRERPRDLRLHAVDGLARLASGRLTGRSEVSPQVRDVSDAPVPPHVRAYVRERLEALARDVDLLVAERAQAALAR